MEQPRGAANRESVYACPMSQAHEKPAIAQHFADKTAAYTARVTACLDRALPPVARGDGIAVFGTGAYGMSMANRYNSMPLPAEIMVDKTERFVSIGGAHDHPEHPRGLRTITASTHVPMDELPHTPAHEAGEFVASVQGLVHS